MARGVVFPFLNRYLPGNFGIEPTITGVKLGTTGGYTINDTATTSIYIPIPHRLCRVIRVSVGGPTAALSAGGTVKLQVFKRTTSAAAPADVALTASTSIEADVITAAGNFDWPVTASDADTVCMVSTAGIGDLIRLDVVASAAVGTQPELVVTVQYNIIR